MSILTIYCDDSGTHPKSRVAVVAGYLGQITQWRRFEKDWKGLLAEFGVTQMHRAKLEAFQGEFEGWNESRRRLFLRRCHLLMREYTKMPIGIAVIKEQFNSILPREIRDKFGGVYGWCAQECIVAARIWCENHSHDEPIQWVFESGTIGHGQVGAMFQELHLHSEWLIKGWAFQDKSVVPLQAADVLAYEVFKQVENQIVDGGNKYPVRVSFQQIIHEKDERYLNYWGEDELREWLVAHEKDKKKKLLSYNA
jgi:hypothetical protein